MNEIKRVRVVKFKFDNDEAQELCWLNDNAEFHLILSEGLIQFSKDGKIFSLFIEQTQKTE